MATTTAGNFGMAAGVALLRFSGTTSSKDSFHLTFSVFLGGAVVLLPIAACLRAAVKLSNEAKQEDRKGRYTSLKAEELVDIAS